MVLALLSFNPVLHADLCGCPIWTVVVSVSCALMISAAADLHPELPFSTPAWLRGGGPCARRWLPWSSLGVMVWKTPLHVLGVQTTLAPRVLWATVLGFIMGLEVRTGCSDLRVGGVRGCVRAMTRVCMAVVK